MTENNGSQKGHIMPTEPQKEKDPQPGKVPIYIDGRKYHPEGDKLTGNVTRGDQTTESRDARRRRDRRRCARHADIGRQGDRAG